MYGTGTRSYNRSTEKRQMDQERAEATAKFEASTREAVEIRWGMCQCRSFEFPHDPARHKSLRNAYDWRPFSIRR